MPLWVEHALWLVDGIRLSREHDVDSKCGFWSHGNRSTCHMTLEDQSAPILIPWSSDYRNHHDEYLKIHLKLLLSILVIIHT